MNSEIQPSPVPPFPSGYRASGILLHVTSLPSAYGVGDLGPVAYAWVNHLIDAGQTWWQSLPLGPTGYGDSPYQSLSSFAGNALLISPDLLIEEGLLQQCDCPMPSRNAMIVDYPTVIRRKHRMLGTAWASYLAGKSRGERSEFEEFCRAQSHWLDDYSLFRALKAHYGGVHYLEWPADLVQRDPGALGAARQDLHFQIDQVRFAQFLLFRQGQRLRDYANAKRLRLIGDLPFFVSGDSSDLWANPQLFMLDRERRPRFISGVPPDAFSADGQLWGSPVYDWDQHRQTGYRWWIDRLRMLLSHVDAVRLDHFRGFAAAWHIPAGASTARTGQWVPGPGADLFRQVAHELGGLPIIAEDLGVITPDVLALREQLNMPSTRVLQFAFDGDRTNPHLPQNYVPNTVVYTGTHDNNTSRGWFEQLSDDQRQRLPSNLTPHRPGSGEVAAEMIGMAWSSVAALAIAPLQDLLNLGSDARMNVPGRPEGNWAWRCSSDMLATAPFDALADLTRRSNRLARTLDAGRSITPISMALDEVST